jgi:hypothetical protein
VYAHNNHETRIDLFSCYNRKTIITRFNTDEKSQGDMMISEELNQIIHLISGWQPFDLTKLNEIDSMHIQVIEGEQANLPAIRLSGKKTRNILGRIKGSAEIIDCNNGGFNILIKMYKGEVLTYRAYLSGDSSPTIGIETQHLKINSNIVREIYKELNYDMPVS